MYVIPEFSSKKNKFGEYSICKYTKPNVENGLFRSIVYKADQIVCFSPPQSISYESFKSKYSDIETVIVEDFIDGTMINLFYDGCWKLCTRSILDAQCTFYSPKTFNQLFHETQINYADLNTSLCYSFVLQHPENRIVTRVNTPTLYLISSYKIEGNVVTEVHEPSSFKRPSQYIFESYEYAEKFVLKRPYEFKGLILKANNDRAKIRNPAYEHVKELRGNSADLKYNYIRLRLESKQNEYTTYFDNEFPAYEQEINEFINELYALYVNCFIKKTKPLKLYPGKYKCHMYKLYMAYLQAKTCVTLDVVTEYINKLHPAQLTFSLKYR
jgi:hypothetical protein